MSLQPVINAITKAARPEMSVELAKAKTAEDVAQIIADSWVGYGLEKTGDASGDEVKLVINTKPETFDGAMRYLWFKPTDEGGGITWRMRGMPYEISTIRKGERHELTVRPLTQAAT